MRLCGPRVDQTRDIHGIRTAFRCSGPVFETSRHGRSVAIDHTPSQPADEMILRSGDEMRFHIGNVSPSHSAYGLVMAFAMYVLKSGIGLATGGGLAVLAGEFAFEFTRTLGIQCDNATAPIVVQPMWCNLLADSQDAWTHFGFLHFVTIAVAGALGVAATAIYRQSGVLPPDSQ